VEDEHVRQPVVASEPPLRIHPAQQRGVGHETPGFVIDHPAFPAIGVHQRRFHPRRRAGHQHAQQGGVLRDPAQVEAHHRQRRVEPHRRGAIEQAGQVATDEAAQRVSNEPAVFRQPPILVNVGCWGAKTVHDHRQDRHLRIPHRRREGGVDGGVLQR